jgi:hypothetical protein
MTQLLSIVRSPLSGKCLRAIIHSDARCRTFDAHTDVVMYSSSTVQRAMRAVVDTSILVVTVAVLASMELTRSLAIASCTTVQ